MHDKSDTQCLIEQILDHPKNSGRDPHARSALAKRLKRLSYAELEQMLHALS